jgi:hypothetical protein
MLLSTTPLSCVVSTTQPLSGPEATGKMRKVGKFMIRPPHHSGSILVPNDEREYQIVTIWRM